MICPDCAMDVGAEHADGCDVARCLWTGHQRLSCHGNHDCGRDVWTGEWPGDSDAVRLEFWCRWTASGWQQCGPDDDGARPDLNRLNEAHARWDREQRRWVALESR